MTATKVDKTPVEGMTGPDGEDLYPESSRSLEVLRHIRLMALLRDMIDAEGGAKTARTLGVSYRTVSRTIDSGRLTARMSASLERHLLLGGGSAAAQQRRQVEALERRVSELEEELRVRIEAIEGGNEATREEQAKVVRQLERRLAALESGRDSPPGPVPEPAKRRVAPSRPYPQLVTLEPEPDEELVYGDAVEVVVEWRRARADSDAAAESGSALLKAVARVRVLELEIELVEERELTLPPATYPWDGFDRREQVWRRRQSLRRARTARARAELRRRLRRVLTFGLWRDRD